MGVFIARTCFPDKIPAKGIMNSILTGFTKLQLYMALPICVVLTFRVFQHA